MPEDPTDEVRLTLPPDPDLRAVVEVAVAVLARRAGLGDEAVRRFRARVGAAFDKGCAAGGGELEVVAALEDRDVRVHLRRGAFDQQISAR
jgi:hypothetical protein